jgi:hypothetical protein
MNIQAKAHTASSTESISFICNGLSAALDSFHEWQFNRNLQLGDNENNHCSDMFDFKETIV